jgi:chloramphenicol 3-O-phosphotransferase
MTATCIVLNGTSCSGKSSIAAALQELWPMPLQVTGIDTFLAAQSKRFFAIGGHGAAGFSWVPATVDGQPAFDVVPGQLGLGMINASHAYWAACAGAGLDQVIDDVWLVPDQPAGLQDALVAANTLWVGGALPAGHRRAAGSRARRPYRWHGARSACPGPHVQEVRRGGRHLGCYSPGVRASDPYRAGGPFGPEARSLLGRRGQPSDFGQRGVEFPPGGDAELREHLAQVPLHRARAEK